LQVAVLKDHFEQRALGHNRLVDAKCEAITPGLYPFKTANGLSAATASARPAPVKTLITSSLSL